MFKEISRDAQIVIAVGENVITLWKPEPGRMTRDWKAAQETKIIEAHIGNPYSAILRRDTLFLSLIFNGHRKA